MSIHTAHLIYLRPAKSQRAALADLLSSDSIAPHVAGSSYGFTLRFGRGRFGLFTTDDRAAETLVDRALPLLAKPADATTFEVLAHKLPEARCATVVTTGLLLTFQARQGREDRAAGFLRSARDVVAHEPGTTAWFAIRAEGVHGILDVFPNQRSRLKHMTGGVPRALMRNAGSMLGSPPRLHLPKVLAANVTKPADILY